jgi:serine phosphatase RsbU (regulator of sigma subunit)
MNRATLSAKEIRNGVIEDVKPFAGSAHQADDMTVLVVKAL